MMTVRVMGKAAFAHIEDGSGRVQIYLKRDVLGEATYDALFRKLVDLGDFITVTGAMFTTRTGEVSCEVHELGLLSKTLNPLPDKWHGVKDVETRFRQRYVDLLANPEVRDVFSTRAKIVKAIRRYLDDNGFLEVETPVLQPIYGGAAARPFVTHHNQLDQDLFLRISFELYLKRLLVGGYERVYEIGRDFRNEGISFKHNPEFTQLELYEAYTDYHGVMARVEELLAAIALEVNGHLKLTYAEHEIDLTPPWRRITMRDAIREATGLDYTLYPDAASLAEAMRAIGHRPESTSRGKLIDSLFATHVEPNLIQPTFITDYPVEISPLAKKHADDPTTVERFEYFIARDGDGQRLHRAERPHRPARALRGAALGDGGRGRERAPAGRGLPGRAQLRDAAHRRLRHRRRPADHDLHQPAIDPGSDPVPAPADGRRSWKLEA